jgi:cobalt-zinc-cadmium efflux system membrane fusion protein
MNKIQLSLFALAFSLGSSVTLADAGHDHGEAAPAASGNSPKRLPDGNVFLPKTSQRQLAVRTVLTEEKDLPQTVELSGKIIMDANAGGRVQATQPGRIEPGSRGLPQLGQVVRKGEVLALVRSSAGAIERANQQSQSAELAAQLEQARRRAARYAQLEGTVPQKDIEAAQADVQSLQARVAAVARSVSATEALVAPVSGVVSLSNVVAGQVVDAREVLFEIVDPVRMVVEALAFDLSLLGNISAASATTGGAAAVPLQFMGAGRSQREGAIPLQFRTDGKQAVPFAINQPVRVLVQTRATVKGVPVPAGALVKSAANQDMVWVHTGAESLAARRVRFVPLDGANVSVVDGLKAGERVVTQGAALVNQVR